MDPFWLRTFESEPFAKMACSDVDPVTAISQRICDLKGPQLIASIVIGRAFVGDEEDIHARLGPIPINRRLASVVAPTPGYALIEPVLNQERVEKRTTLLDSCDGKRTNP